MAEPVAAWVTATVAEEPATATPWVLPIAWVLTVRSAASPSLALMVLEAVTSLGPVLCCRLPVRGAPARSSASPVLPVAAVTWDTSPALPPDSTSSSVVAVAAPCIDWVDCTSSDPESAAAVTALPVAVEVAEVWSVTVVTSSVWDAVMFPS